MGFGTVERRVSICISMGMSDGVRLVWCRGYVYVGKMLRLWHRCFETKHVLSSLHVKQASSRISALKV